MTHVLSKCCSPALRVFKRLAPTALTFLVIILLAAVGYSLIEGADLLRSLYWSVVTGFTVGFGDVLPTGGAGMLLCILYIPASAITFAVLGAHIVGIVIDDRHKFTDEEQQRVLGRLDEMACEVQAVVNHLNLTVDYSENGATNK